MFTAGATGVIILLAILRLSSKWGIKKVLITIGLVYVVGIITFYFVSNPIKLVERVFDYYPHIDQYFGFLENSSVKFLPNFWLQNHFIGFPKIELKEPFHLSMQTFSLQF